MSRKLVVLNVPQTLSELWTVRDLRWAKYKDEFKEMMSAIYHKQYDNYMRIISKCPELVVDSLLVFFQFFNSSVCLTMVYYQ